MSTKNSPLVYALAFFPSHLIAGLKSSSRSHNCAQLLLRNAIKRNHNRELQRFGVFLFLSTIISRWGSWIIPNVVTFHTGGTHRLSPENGSVLRNPLVVLV